MKYYKLFIMLLFMPVLYANDLPSIKPWPQQILVSSAKEKYSIKCHIQYLYYIDRSMLQLLLKQKNMHWLSSEGSVQLLKEKHQVIICDDNKHYQKLLSILLQLNKPPKQIKIRAKIIRIDKNYLHDLGFNFNSEKNQSDKKDDSGGDLTKNGLKMVLTTLRAQDLLTLQLHALVNQGHAEIIANPTILAHANVAANIESGEEVPYQEGALNGGTSIAFKKAVMQLAVTPHISRPNYVSLNIKVHQDKVTPATVNGVPIISTEQLSTTATIKNHNTLLLGGIIEKQISRQVEGVPILRHLPIIGLLFQRHRKQIDKKELLIMITPEWH